MERDAEDHVIHIDPTNRHAPVPSTADSGAIDVRTDDRT